jgi:hypothetical protein
MTSSRLSIDIVPGIEAWEENAMKSPLAERALGLSALSG